MTFLNRRSIASICIALACILAPLAATLFTWNDLINHSGQKLSQVETSSIFLVVFCTLLLFLFLQVYPTHVLKSLTSELGVVIGTITLIPLIVSAFAYAYLRVPHSEFSVDKNKAPIVICEKNHASQCLYFSAVTFTTLGYGDIKPTGPARSYAIGEAFLGFAFVPLIISLLLNVFVDARKKMQAANRKQRARLKRNEDLEVAAKERRSIRSIAVAISSRVAPLVEKCRKLGSSISKRFVKKGSVDTGESFTAGKAQIEGSDYVLVKEDLRAQIDELQKDASNRGLNDPPMSIGAVEFEGFSYIIVREDLTDQIKDLSKAPDNHDSIGGN
ncbi:MAG: potassium channel family protein [Granulosicoccus sp.]